MILWIAWATERDSACGRVRVHHPSVNKKVCVPESSAKYYFTTFIRTQ